MALDGLMSAFSVSPANDMIFVAHPMEMDDEEFMKKLTELEAATRKNSMDIKRMIADIVGNYKINF
ncbi:MAG: hypothetical protein II778_08215 [Anaerovibrio sp.]|nr:hypothetical protein [Anaerovibrio sp.]